MISHTVVSNVVFRIYLDLYPIVLYGREMNHEYIRYSIFQTYTHPVSNSISYRCLTESTGFNSFLYFQGPVPLVDTVTALLRYEDLQ